MKKLSTLFLTPVVTLVLLNANAAVAAEKASETTPQNMTCREYLDMNAKAMTPVAYWAINNETVYKGGDTVDWNETDTVSVPKLIKICHEKPESKIMQWVNDIR
ncbi:acid-activated periplasmic chaperone HdeB [Klebsiella pneumoniae]|uniref:acid-activated periplasmic chaperone HdeB n=1 Tax=Klebsiella pneumoniae TaxID=573 RepID=UPI0031350378